MRDREKEKDRKERERVLWEMSTRDVAPLARKRKKRGALVAREGEAVALSPSPSSDKQGEGGKKKRMSFVPLGEASSSPAVPVARGAGGAGKASITKAPASVGVRRGEKIRIEARIDLHGLSQDAAHAALVRFLLSCHARGVRLVLVITGKGARRSAPESAHWADPVPGVLRRMVPEWLRAGDLAGIVAGVQAAGAAHGGDGALYVRLRRK